YVKILILRLFFFSSRRRHTRFSRDWSSDVCSSDLPDYMQEALVPLAGETHGGEDVGIWARGPGSGAFRGTLEQHVIYHVIVQATPKLRERLCAAGTCDANGVPVELPDPADFTGAK